MKSALNVEVIKIIVVCNNRDKEWCPYGLEDCECDCYEPKELKYGKCLKHTCTDKNYQERKCKLEDYEKFKMRKQLEKFGYGVSIINQLYSLIKKDITPDIYEKYYRMVKNAKVK